MEKMAETLRQEKTIIYPLNIQHPRSHSLGSNLSIQRYHPSPWYSAGNIRHKKRYGKQDIP
jgi:hypothetical protein